MFRSSDEEVAMLRPVQTRHLLIAGSVATFAFAQAFATSAAHASTVTSPAVTADIPCVTTATLTGVSPIAADGSPAPAVLTNPAHAYHFALNGSDITQIVPPKGWTPVGGSAEELATYGFPARPTDSTGAAAWNDIFSHWKSAAAPGMCSTDRSAAGLRHTGTSPNWSGGMTINNTTNVNTYYDSTVKWTQPGFTAQCPSRSGYAVWAGLGGYNYNNGAERLIQDGTDVGSSLNSIFPWWELWQTNDHTTEAAFTGSGYISPGDDMYADATFNAIDSGAPGTASFQVFDQTTGTSWNTEVPSYDGHTIRYYYDGSTADAISEAPTFGSTIGNLRKTAGTNFTYFTANYNDLKYFDSWALNQIDSSGYEVQDTSFDGVHAWTDYWYRCS